MLNKLTFLFLSEDNRRYYNEAPLSIKVRFCLGIYGSFILALWLLIAVDIFDFPKSLVTIVSIGIGGIIGLWLLQWVRYKNQL